MSVSLLGSSTDLSVSLFAGSSGLGLGQNDGEQDFSSVHFPVSIYAGSLV